MIALHDHCIVDVNDTQKRQWGGYLNGNLKGSKQAADAPALPDGYTKTMKIDAEQQADLAGFRLGLTKSRNV